MDDIVSRLDRIEHSLNVIVEQGEVEGGKGKKGKRKGKGKGKKREHTEEDRRVADWNEKHRAEQLRISEQSHMALENAKHTLIKLNATKVVLAANAAVLIARDEKEVRIRNGQFNNIYVENMLITANGTEHMLNKLKTSIDENDIRLPELQTQLQHQIHSLIQCAINVSTEGRGGSAFAHNERIVRQLFSEKTIIATKDIDINILKLKKQFSHTI